MDKKTIIIICETIILLLLVGVVWGVFRSKLDVSNQNLRAAKGEIEVLKGENDKLIFARDSYILQKNELEELLGISKKEIKALEKKLDSSLSYISELEGKVIIKEVVTTRDSIVYVTPENAINRFNYNDKWITLNGSNNITFNSGKIEGISTTLDNITMGLDLRIGLTENNKFFAETDNPYVTFNSIEGAYLNKRVADKKRVKFTWGFQLGFGASYGLISKSMDVGPYGGFGIGLSF